jgi:alanine dehydrogenase
MRIGVPREIKADEYRVALLPAGVALLKRHGHEVMIETRAGIGSGLSDADYASAGAKIVDSADLVWHNSDMVVKVKEPQPAEWGYFRKGLRVMTYFHFAAERALAEACIGAGIIAIAYETIRDEQGTLPCLTPMSEIAGKMSIQEGAKYLERPMMGRGILLGGVTGVMPAHVVILGAGTVGHNAARVAAGLGAQVTLMDVNLNRLRYMADVMPPNVTTLYSDEETLRWALKSADLVVGAVLIPGARAPRLVSRAALADMQAGSVLVDVAIDQGGCFETSRPTTHQSPVYIVDDVVHYCVTNMPGAVGRTSTFALCNATIKYVAVVAEITESAALMQNPRIASGVNMMDGRVVHPAVAAALTPV